MAKRQRDALPLQLLKQEATRMRCLRDNLQMANKRLAPLVLQAWEQNDNSDFHLLMKKSGWDASSSRFAGHADVVFLADELPKYQYKKVAALGKGSYATVYKATDRESQDAVAIKKLRRVLQPGDTDQGIPCSTLREISHLMDLKHENIIELKDVSWSYGSSSVYVVLECLDCDLRQHLNRCKEASRITNIKMYLHQMLSGLNFAHNNLVMHRDLKPQNILVDEKRQQLKLADFGLARSFLPATKAYTHNVVTLWYRAPELLLGAVEYSSAVDMWSIGCIFAEMVNFSPLFQGGNEVGQLLTIFQMLGTPTAQDWPEICQLAVNTNFYQYPRQDLAKVVPRLAEDPQALSLLSGLLAYDPKARLTAAEALAHPWFDEPSEERLPPVMFQRTRSDSSDGSCQSFEAQLEGLGW